MARIVISLGNTSHYFRWPCATISNNKAENLYKVVGGRKTIVYYQQQPTNLLLKPLRFYLPKIFTRLLVFPKMVKMRRLFPSVHNFIETLEQFVIDNSTTNRIGVLFSNCI